MEIIYSTSHHFGSTGLGYISLKTAEQLEKRQCLKKIIVESYIKNSLIKKTDKVTVPPFSKNISQLLNLSYMNNRNIFDLLAAKKIEKADIFHGFSHESLFCFNQAKKLGLKRFLDHPNTHVDFQNKLLLDEAKTFNVNFKPYNRLELLKVKKEFEKANKILLLSNLAMETFKEKGFDEEKLVKNPYGVDTELFKPTKEKKDEIFQVVFVGQIGLRKGVQYLLAAWTKLKLKNAELVLVGWINPNILKVLKKFRNQKDIKILKQLSDLKKIARIYQNASVCVFPSIEDGWAMTVTEAMASGKPVVVSENTGAKDVVIEGKNGFIIPIRDTKAIKEKIQYFYDNPNESKRMGKEARKTALKLSWDKYGERLVKAYKEVLE